MRQKSIRLKNLYLFPEKQHKTAILLVDYENTKNRQYSILTKQCTKTCITNPSCRSNAQREKWKSKSMKLTWRLESSVQLGCFTTSEFTTVQRVHPNLWLILWNWFLHEIENCRHSFHHQNQCKTKVDFHSRSWSTVFFCNVFYKVKHIFTHPDDITGVTELFDYLYNLSRWWLFPKSLRQWRILHTQTLFLLLGCARFREILTFF